MEEFVVPAKVGDTAVLVEVRRNSYAGDPEVDVALRAPSFDGVVKSIKAITRELTSALEELRPDKASLEFGVDVGVEAGQLTALLVKGSGSATLKITLEWEKAA